jgi:hypothetical protein
VIRQPSREHEAFDWAAASSLLLPDTHEPALARQRTSDPGWLARWVGALREGNRHDGLFWAACRAAEAGQLDGLEAIADAARATGLPDEEVRRTIASAVRTAQLASKAGEPAREPHEHGSEAAK